MSSDDGSGVYDDDPEEPLEGELVMPFLPVASRGGPFEDHAYVCGWEAAEIACLLRQAHDDDVTLPLEERLALPVHRENVEQLDLIAMRFGHTMEREPWEGDPAWVFVRFTRIESSTLSPPTA